jgi:GntR family transcriptional regulator
MKDPTERTPIRRVPPPPETERGRPSFVSDAVPLYYQLGSVLREKIVSGQFTPGERIPTEAELADSYGVSRITVRQALGVLERDALIRREAGRGTFVCDLPSFSGDLKVEGSLDHLIWMGEATTIRLLELATVEATPRHAERLALKPGSRLTRCARLRFYHGEPLSYVVMLLPEDIGRRVPKQAWKKGSILQALARLGYALRDADQTVTASLADATLARHLHTRIGAPLLSVDRVVRTADGRPVQDVHTFYRSDIYSVRVHLVRDASEHTEHVSAWSVRRSGKTR